MQNSLKYFFPLYNFCSVTKMKIFNNDIEINNAFENCFLNYDCCSNFIFILANYVNIFKIIKNYA